MTSVHYCLISLIISNQLDNKPLSSAQVTMIVEILLTVAQVLVFLFDVVTYPVYKALAKYNAQRQEKSSTPRAQLVKESSETISWKREKSQENAVYKEYIIDNKVKCEFAVRTSSKLILSGGHRHKGLQLCRG